MDNQTYLEQIDKFYKGILRTDQVIGICTTPEYLMRLGIKSLPVVIKQSTLSKCIRERRGSRSAHELDRQMIESLPYQIQHPILAVNEKQRGSFALITDYKDKDGNNMLVALKLNSTIHGIDVNEVVSFYGRNNLKIYLGKHEMSDIYVINNKKAKSLASLLGLQLPMALQEFSYADKISHHEKSVNSEFP